MPFNGVVLFENEPDRECWHEAGHSVVANHLGMTVIAIGYSWVRGEHEEPNPSSWIPTDGFDKEAVGTEMFAGVAAEILKLGAYDMMACNVDVHAFKQLGCTQSHEYYINKAMDVLRERDAALVRVYEKLVSERTNPTHEPFIDDDGMKKQRHLSQEQFEALM